MMIQRVRSKVVLKHKCFCSRIKKLIRARAQFGVKGSAEGPLDKWTFGPKCSKRIYRLSRLFTVY